MGTLNWGYNSSGQRFYAPLPTAKTVNSTANFICSRYKGVRGNDLDVIQDKNGCISITTYQSIQNNLLVWDDSFSGDAAAFKSAMSGQNLAYELATEEDVLVADDLLYDQVSLMIEKGGVVTVSESALAGAVELDIPVKRFQN